MSSSTFDPNNAQNLDDIEKQFAVAVVEHMATYEKLISQIPPRKLSLTKLDDVILTHLIKEFPELTSPDNNYAQLRNLDENAMKTPKGKEMWRNFCMTYENIVPDYNFGTLIRADCTKDYAQDNTVLVLRTQFLAIEIARNKYGLNDAFHEAAQRGEI